MEHHYDMKNWLWDRPLFVQELDILFYAKLPCLAGPSAKEKATWSIFQARLESLSSQNSLLERWLGN